MRILFISPRYYPNIGGVEYVVKSIAERLAKMGHKVTVLTGEPDTEKPKEENVNVVSVIQWPNWSLGKRALFHQTWSGLLTFTGKQLQLLRAFYRLLPVTAPLLALAGEDGKAWMMGIRKALSTILNGHSPTKF